MKKSLVYAALMVTVAVVTVSAQIQFDSADPVSQFHAIKAQGKLMPVAAVRGTPVTNSQDTIPKSIDISPVVVLVKRINNGEIVEKSEVAKAQALLQAKFDQVTSLQYMAYIKKQVLEANSTLPKEQQLPAQEIDDAITRRQAKVISVIGKAQDILKKAKTK